MSVADTVLQARTANNPKASLTTPLSRWGSLGKPYDPAAFDKAHRARDAERDLYLHLGYARYQKLDRGTLEELGRDGERTLAANNMTARIKYAHIASDAVAEFLKTLPPDTKAFWVTLIRDRYTVSLDDAVTFDPSGLKGWVHHVLRGAHYFGIVEAGFYSNLSVVGSTFNRAVSWHAHFLMWGKTRREMTTLKKETDARYGTAIPGRHAFDWQEVTHGQAADKTLYMHKGQLKEYRVYPLNETTVDEDGIITISTTGKFEQKKRDIRRGDAVRMTRVFAGRTIDGLAVYAGDGRGLFRTIQKTAAAPLRAWERKQPWSDGSRAARLKRPPELPPAYYRDRRQNQIA